MAKLVQLNTWGGRLYRQVQNFLAAQKPDIAHLQEVTSSPKGKTSFFDMLQIAEKATSLEHVFFSPTMATQYGEKPIYYGNAILSRYPLANTFCEFTHRTFNPSYEADRDDYNVRNFQHAVVTLESGARVNLLNYHGYHDRDSKSGGPLTQRHCARIADYIRDLKGPVVLTGDFNLSPDAPSLDPLYAILNNVGQANGVMTTRNFLARSQDAVDMIWVSQDVQVRHFAVMPDIISDHAALVIEFDAA